MDPTVPTRKPEELQQVLHYQFRNPGPAAHRPDPHQLRQRKQSPHHPQRTAGIPGRQRALGGGGGLSVPPVRPAGGRTDPHARQPGQRGSAVPVRREIRLGDYLRLGRGEELGGGRSRPSVVSDAFEAVIAALYLDGGLEAARNFILPFLSEGKTAEDDYKTRLQEVVQQRPGAHLRYEVEGETGPDHAKQVHRGGLPRRANAWPKAWAAARKPPSSTPRRKRCAPCRQKGKEKACA